MKRPSKSFEIALSAIACAVAALALTLGAYVDVMYAAGLLLAVFALMVPLSKEFIWGDALAFLGAALLAFLFCGFSVYKLIPFLTFLGLHPLVNFLQKKYVKRKWLHAIVFLGKALWFCLALWLSWQVVLVKFFALDQTSWYPFVMKYFYYVLFFGGIVAFAAYDYLIFLCQRSVNAIVKRIRR